MQITSLEFCSLLSYSPWGTTDPELRSKTLKNVLKTDQPILDPPVLMSEFVADDIRRNLLSLSFSRFFTENTVLVPTPKSSLIQPGTLWVPQRIARALHNRGLGRAVVECVNRKVAVRKSQTSPKQERPKASEHYASMEVLNVLSEPPSEILLIDDIVTRGATLLGAANRLRDAYPSAVIRAFTVMRTMSPPFVFSNWYAPCTGSIELRGADAFRKP